MNKTYGVLWSQQVGTFWIKAQSSLTWRRGNERSGAKWEGESERLRARESGNGEIQALPPRRWVGGPGGGEQAGGGLGWGGGSGESRLSTGVAEYKSAWRLLQPSFPSPPTPLHNENCVWKQCHLQRRSGKKLWSGPVQLHGSQTNCVKDVMSGQVQQSGLSLRAGRPDKCMVWKISAWHSGICVSIVTDCIGK